MNPASIPTDKSPRFGLSTMMFLQYAVWGAWLPIVGRYLMASPDDGGLGFSLGQLGIMLGLAGSIGAITSPFIAGQFADRYFRAERVLAVLLFTGGILKWYTSYQTTFTAWIWLSIAYSVVYMPTLALSNSIAFSHLRDSETEFPYVRVWGTIGWIAASWIFPMLYLQTDLSLRAMPPFLVGAEVENVTGRLVGALKFSGVISIGYSMYCFALPSTPPKRESVEPLAFKKAFEMFNIRSFAVLVAASLPISTIHQIYFIQTSPFLASIGVRDSMIMPAMTIGQFSEIVVMAGLGMMLKRAGFRWVIFLGTFSYVVRYAIFGTVSLPVEIIVASQFLHGFCYACFFAAGFIYVDRIAPEDIRHSVQTVFGIMILGGGPVLGGWLVGFLDGIYPKVDGGPNFSAIWYTLSGIALVTGIFFVTAFRDQIPDRSDAMSEEAEANLEETL